MDLEKALGLEIGKTLGFGQDNNGSRMDKDTMDNLNKPFNSIGAHLREIFGEKVIKLSLDGGFTCPNRDGSCGTGGCIFCSADGSGENASDIPGQLALLSKKWPHGKYIVYFQNHTNTYAPVAELREKYYAALEYSKRRKKEIESRPAGDASSELEKQAEIESLPEIVGIAIATRPDCLSDEVLELLSELNKETYLWVELGLQTIHEETARTINRGYELAVFDEAMEKLKARNIRAVVHLIFGLPKSIPGAASAIVPETREEMLESVRYVCEKEPFGIKLHLLNVIRGSQMEHLCPDYVPFDSLEEYVGLVCDALAIIPSCITIHRLTADAPRPLLIAPEWSYRKRSILNSIEKELRARNSYQGCHFQRPGGYKL